MATKLMTLTGYQRFSLFTVHFQGFCSQAQAQRLFKWNRTMGWTKTSNNYELNTWHLLPLFPYCNTPGLDFAGDAMSPPVLGTLLLLCLGYILPAGNNCAPLTWRGDAQVLPTGPWLPGSGSAGSGLCGQTCATISTNVSASPSHVNLEGVTEGLAGVFILQKETSSALDSGSFGTYVEPDLKNTRAAAQMVRCGNCYSQFKQGDCVYQWRSKVAQSPMTLLHERCVLSAVEDSGAQNALERVQRLLTGADHEKLLGSLFGLEDDLTRLESLLSQLQEPNLLSQEERPQKLRRMQVHI